MLYSAMKEEKNKINECTSITNMNVSIPNITILLHVIEHQSYYYSSGNEELTCIVEVKLPINLNMLKSALLMLKLMYIVMTTYANYYCLCSYDTSFPLAYPPHALARLTQLQKKANIN
jgi:hypothetical protein